MGTGGGAAVTRPVKIAGDINDARDFPIPPGGRQVRLGHSVTIAMTVGADGRAQRFNQGAVYVWMEDQASRRRPNVMLADFRVEKTFSIGAYRFGGLFDLFNVFNSNAMTTTTDMTGASFDRWTEILTPRIFRVGFRATF